MSWQVLEGDCLAVLPTLPAGSVHCVVTSPPYWGLRDYGVEGQLGLERTPEEYVEKLVVVFREVRRVLRDDGTLWLNLGDSYAGSGPSGASYESETTKRRADLTTDGAFRLSKTLGPRGLTYAEKKPVPPASFKPKDLVGIPWKVAQALQAPYYVGRIKDPADRAWLAGFLDGEGTISFVERDRGVDHTPTHDVRVFFTNCDRAPLDYFAAMTAGHVYEHDGERVGRLGSRPCYRWQMGTHDSALLLRELYPHLRTKRRQAALVWTLYGTLRHKNGHVRTPAAVVERRQAIAEMIRTLNSGGEVNLPAWVEAPPSATEEGWYLRSEIIWAKRNCMPESVEDRPTRAHEQVFLLTKAARYFYDAVAVAEEIAESTADDRVDTGRFRPDRGFPGSASAGNGRLGSAPTRNRRSVWWIATQAFADAHFATMPPALVEPCILAGTSAKGACPACGAPWRRVVERGELLPSKTGHTRPVKRAKIDQGDSSAWSRPFGLGATQIPGAAYEYRTTGWAPTCACPVVDPVPCTVLDPFAGACTTLLVADRLGRHGIGIELSPAYAAMGRRRLTAEAPLLSGLGA